MRRKWQTVSGVRPGQCGQVGVSEWKILKRCWFNSEWPILSWIMIEEWWWLRYLLIECGGSRVRFSIIFFSSFCVL